MEIVIATLMATVIGLLSTTGVIRYIHMGAQNVQNSVAARELSIFCDAATRYIQDYGSTLLSTTNATAALPVTAAMLNAAGELPLGYVATNSFQQTLQLQILQPTAGKLEALVVSTGPAIADPKQLIAVAAQSGAQGGFIPYANQAGDASLQPTSAYGTYGAWKVPLAGFTNPGAGHLAALLAFNGASNNNDYLYRVNVGQPALNSMQTDLGMTDVGGTAHNITGINTATAQTYSVNGQGKFSADQGGSLDLGGNSTTAGTGTPYINFHQGGQPAQNFNVQVVNDADNHLTINAAGGTAAVAINGTLQLANIATDNASCPKNGQMAGNVDGSGQIFECLNLVWTPIGGKWMRMASNAVANGGVVAAPVCSAGGVGRLELAAQTFYVDPTATVNVYASPAGGTGPWTVSIVDGSGNAIAGQVLAETYCQY
ncbi:shufflon system plasmid conjugative transfer pilus tip adhesin PilV [Paraburkholderia sp. BR10872]|uniref:shufflon system plasmid conjugative transfer pilus tip adhesin PilV n=1 Tax=Paraburkholderia sp. BR10872 TaxID=3236989 RepID=UPI0034D1AE27